ncbi:MAG: diaminopimelate epimerase [Candidatus Omnitrophica bacterium]|nr:diaminopimelate epimerase [Candidatus Omnitrophota bacterium]
MIKFTKSVATGNDFVIVDNRSWVLKGDLAGIAKRLCDRFYGVGADGLLLVEKSKTADFKMRIFNSDGSEAEMCGNGSRCAALYAFAKKIAPADMKIETMAGILNANVKGQTVKVKLTDPKDIQWNLCLMIHECPYKVNFANTGVPHVIHFVNDLESVEVKNLGPKMRYHEEFSPHGANVDFVKITDKNSNKIAVRTYERGVENETLACGTGAVASAIISAEAEKLESPITVETKSGEVLKVYFESKEGNFKNVYLEGKAKLVYEGEIENV